VPGGQNYSDWSGQYRFEAFSDVMLMFTAENGRLVVVENITMCRIPSDSPYAPRIGQNVLAAMRMTSLEFTSGGLILLLG